MLHYIIQHMKRGFDYLASILPGKELPKRFKKDKKPPAPEFPKRPTSPNRANPADWIRKQAEYEHKVSAYIEYVSNYDIDSVPAKYKDMALRDANEGMGPVLYAEWSELPLDMKQEAALYWKRDLIRPDKTAEEETGRAYRRRMEEEERIARAKAIQEEVESQQRYNEFLRNLPRAKPYETYGERMNREMEMYEERQRARNENPYKTYEERMREAANSTRRRRSSSEERRRRASSEERRRRASSEERRRRASSEERRRQQAEAEEQRRQEERRRQEEQRQQEYQRPQAEAQGQQPQNPATILGLKLSDLNKSKDPCREISVKFKKESLKFHPDKYKGDDSDEKYKSIVEAKDKLDMMFNCGSYKTNYDINRGGRKTRRAKK